MASQRGAEFRRRRGLDNSCTSDTPVLLLKGSRFSVRNLRVALAQGYSPAGDCLSPVAISLKGAPDPLRVGLMLEKDQPAIANYDVRCRGCENCLRHRARLWSARACAEIACAPRTWFGTLTLRPESRVRYLYRADLDVSRRRCEPWASLDATEQYRKLVEVISPEVTRFLKRVRKASAARLRYLLVSEAHKDGFPHFHMLVHEVSGNVTKRQMEASWRDGFSQWRLLPVGDNAAAFYVSKYLSKSALTRVRASQRYGQIGHYADFIAETLESVSEQAQRSQRSEEGSLSERRLTNGSEVKRV